MRLFYLVLLKVHLEVRDPILPELFGTEMIQVSDVAADLAPAGTAHDDHIGIFLFCKLSPPVVQVEEPHSPLITVITSLELRDQCYIVSTGNDTYPSCIINHTNTYHHGRSTQ